MKNAQNQAKIQTLQGFPAQFASFVTFSENPLPESVSVLIFKKWVRLEKLSKLGSFGKIEQVGAIHELPQKKSAKNEAKTQTPQGFPAQFASFVTFSENLLPESVSVIIFKKWVRFVKSQKTSFFRYNVDMMSNTILRKSRHEIALIKDAGRIVADTLTYLISIIEPGITTLDLDRIAEEWIRKAGAAPTFKGYHGFPATLCTSVNEEVVHGIPSAERVLKEGDIISLDCGATYKGLVGDSAITVGVGEISDDLKRLLEATQQALESAITKVVAGNYIEDVSGAIEDVGLKYGYGIVRNYGGHGVGKQLHEEPFIHNFRTGDRGPELKQGAVIAIEPMFNIGGDDVRTAEDHWTVVTQDGLPSAHFEHTVIVTEDEPVVATERKS